MITIHTDPHQYSAGYSAIPLRLSSDNIDTDENFKYLISIAYDKAVESSNVPVSVGSLIFTEITTTAAHNFNLGDTILLQDSGAYQGFYIIQSVPAANKIIIDLILSVPMTGTINLYKVIKYDINPDLQGEAKLLIDNTLKDFVTQNLEDVNESFDADDTMFQFDVLIGEQKKYVFEFEDNGSFYGGSGYGLPGCVSFYNSAITSLVGCPFQIGDEVTIMQDMAEWQYDDNFFSGGDLAFTSTNIHNFEVGNAITVTGQSTQPAYNGPTQVKAVIDAYNIKVFKPHNTSTPVEGGSIFGHPRPEYNATCKIVDINIHGTYGLVISTDIGFAGASQPIPGKMRFADGRLTTLVDEEDLKDLRVYNAGLLKYTYDVAGFDRYVIQNRNANSNYFSTIYSIIYRNRIELDSKSWLLAHVYNDSYVNNITYTFFDINDNNICTMRLDIANTNTQDFYFPIGVNQLAASVNTTLVSGTALSSLDLSTIVWYRLAGANWNGSVNTTRTRTYQFEINKDCVGYTVYHLMWKDRFGSWLSYPFKYISRQSTEFERKNYYKQEGVWDLDADTFDYPTYDRGETTFYGRSRDKLILNTGNINETENALIKDLLASTKVYVQDSADMLVGVIPVVTDQQFYKKENEGVWNYTFEVRLSMNESRY